MLLCGRRRLLLGGWLMLMGYKSSLGARFGMHKDGVVGEVWAVEVW
jgi:hypothetical protein